VPSNVPATPTTSTSTTANVTVPGLVGLTEAAATARLGALGLTPSAITMTQNKNPAYDGLVLSQKPPAHTSVPPGSVVIINVERYVPPTSTSTSSTASSTASTTTSATSSAGGIGATSSAGGIGGPGD
jgi:beta-lactam-binding protein with PASTA domain